MKCPCHSLKSYEKCCAPYHNGNYPRNALALMRSRYAAYALDLPEYIMATTHPDHPSAKKDPKMWRHEIDTFSQETDFIDLKILSDREGDDTAFVEFRAILKNQGHDVSFTEKSRFLKVDDRWLYESGEILL